MANWTDIDVNRLLPGEPITSALMLALDENPRAIAESAPSAPVIQTQWHPYDMTNYAAVGANTGEGVLWDFDVDGAVNAVETPVFLLGYSYRVTAFLDRPFSLHLFSEPSSSYSPVYNAGSLGTVPRVKFTWEIIQPWTEDYTHNGHLIFSHRDLPDESPKTTGFVNINVRQVVTRARIQSSSGGFGGNGKIILEKKLDALAGVIS